MKRFLLCCLILTASAPGQRLGKATAGPFFFLDAANVASKDSTKGRIEAFVKIAYNELLFAKFQANLYRAQYEISYVLYDRAGNLINRDIQNREIITDKFAETESDLRYHFSRITLNVEPGEYSLVVTISDQETRREGQRKLNIPVRTFRDRLIGLSDLIFADKIQKDSLLDIVNIIPNVFRSFDNDYTKYRVFFEIYDSRFAWKNRDGTGQKSVAEDVIKLRYRVLDKKQKVMFEDSSSTTVRQFQTFSSVELDKGKLSYGKYILDVTAYLDGQRATSKAIFDVRLSTFANPTMNSGTFDLDAAIRQMRHVARSANLGKILKGEDSTKARFFSEFWRQRDPSPGTERNELMEEYYRRIDYANSYFTAGNREGWDTDRGMVFVILNAPDDIERHPYDPDSKPYEVWYYYQANLKLFFVDYSQIGDYELANRQEFENYIFLHRQ
ncbi:MAG: GWxTD domain-containing protein [Bacteroidetes bacterium]|nr:GWxTD domain-containing protein [Bacteroidota bacterium]